MKAGLLFLVLYVAAVLPFHIICHLIEYLAHLIDCGHLAYRRGVICKVGDIKGGAVAVA